MKKKILLLLMFVAFCGSAGAQKGRSGVGVGLGFIGILNMEFVPYESMAPSIGLKYNYGISNMFEVEPWMTFYPTTIIGNYVHSHYLNNGNSYYYNFEKHVTLDFSFRFSCGVNLNTYLLKTRFRPFIVTGLAMNIVQWPEYTFELDDYYSQGKLVTNETIITGGEKGTKIAFRGGIGGDYRVSYHSYLQLIVFYDTFASLGASLGYTYKF